MSNVTPSKSTLCIVCAAPLDLWEGFVCWYIVQRSESAVHASLVSS